LASISWEDAKDLGYLTLHNRQFSSTAEISVSFKIFQQRAWLEWQLTLHRHPEISCFPMATVAGEQKDHQGCIRDTS